MIDEAIKRHRSEGDRSHLYGRTYWMMKEIEAQSLSVAKSTTELLDFPVQSEKKRIVSRRKRVARIVCPKNRSEY